MKKISCDEFNTLVLELQNKFLIAKELECTELSVRNWCKKCNSPKLNGFHKKLDDMKVVKRNMDYLTDEFRILMRNRTLGVNNPFFGKHHSESTKEKMRKNHADFNGQRNPLIKWLNKDDSNRTLLKEKYKKSWANRNTDWRKEFSETISRTHETSPRYQTYKFHKHGKIIHSKCGEAYFRSSYELALINQLIENSNVISFEMEPFPIHYMDGVIRRHTRPDCYVTLNNGINVLIECKPKKLIHYGKNVIKISACKHYCHDNNIPFIIFTEDYIADTNKLIQEFNQYKKQSYTS